MRKICAYLTIASFFSTSAFADPAVLTANVNFRTGPGTGFEAMRVVKQGEEVDIKECDAGAAWCAVSYAGTNGFVAGKYLNQSNTSAPAWPRVFNTESGATITLFQPQITDWTDFKQLDALIATELKLPTDAKPLYGIIGVSAKTVADDENENVTLTEVKATRVEFSTLDRQQLSDLSLEVGKLMPTDPIVVSEDRLTASLADYKRLVDVTDIKADPPPIFTSEVPAILVQTNGKAVSAPVKGVQGLSFVANTNWDLLKADATNAYYLRDDKSWLTSKTLESGWAEADTVPDVVSSLPDDDNWKDAKAALPPVPFAGKPAPKVFYSDKPAELMIFEGKPAFEPVPGTALAWVSNTTGAVFYYKPTKAWYTLLSGRWFSSAQPRDRTVREALSRPTIRARVMRSSRAAGRMSTAPGEASPSSMAANSPASAADRSEVPVVCAGAIRKETRASSSGARAAMSMPGVTATSIDARTASGRSTRRMAGSRLGRRSVGTSSDRSSGRRQTDHRSRNGPRDNARRPRATRRSVLSTGCPRISPSTWMDGS